MDSGPAEPDVASTLGSYERRRIHETWRPCCKLSIAPGDGSPSIEPAVTQHPHLELEVRVAINTSKVVVGGLAAGVVANVVGFLLFGLWLGPTFKSEINAVASGLGDKGETGAAMTWMILGGIVVGLVLAWLYA